MILKWDVVKYGCGHASIDAQHKALFDMVNKLHDATATGHGRDQLPQMMEFLRDYVVKHFSHEEGIMARCKCPAAAENKRAHAEFLAKFTELYTAYKAQGNSVSIVLQIQAIASQWLTSHILKVDTKAKDSALVGV